MRAPHLVKLQEATKGIEKQARRGGESAKNFDELGHAVQ